jgi:ABC-type transport system substrate-binding protein
VGGEFLIPHSEFDQRVYDAPSMKSMWAVPTPLAAPVVVLALLAAGCGPEPPASRLRMTYPHELVTMDPHAHSDGVTRRVLSAVYEGLVQFEPGSPVRPCLADRWTTPDAFTWRIHLRDGVRFHDGRRLTADDVVASIERARSSENRGRQLDDIERIRVAENDVRTIEVKTRHPAPLLLTRLESVAIVPRDFKLSVPNGTGPYRLLAGSVDGPVLLERWDDYWARAPDFDQITIQFVSLLEELADLVDSQNLDVVALAQERFVNDFEPTLGWRVEALPTVATTYLGINITTPPFDDLRVRKAIDDLIDRKQLVSEIYPPGNATPAYSLVSPKIFGYGPEQRAEHPNPAQARQLLVDAGVKPGTELNLDFQARYEPVVAPLAAMLAEAGLVVVPRMHEYETFYRRLEEAENELFFFSWNFRVPDASPFLELFVQSRNPDRGYGSFNGAALRDPEIDRLLGEAARETRSESRLDLLQELLADVDAKYAYLPLFRPAPIALVRDPFEVVGHCIRPQDVRLR